MEDNKDKTPPHESVDGLGTTDVLELATSYHSSSTTTSGEDTSQVATTVSDAGPSSSFGGMFRVII